MTDTIHSDMSNPFCAWNGQYVEDMVKLMPPVGKENFEKLIYATNQSSSIQRVEIDEMGLIRGKTGALLANACQAGVRVLLSKRIQEEGIGWFCGDD